MEDDGKEAPSQEWKEETVDLGDWMEVSRPVRKKFDMVGLLDILHAESNGLWLQRGVVLDCDAQTLHYFLSSQDFINFAADPVAFMHLAQASVLLTDATMFLAFYCPRFHCLELRCPADTCHPMRRTHYLHAQTREELQMWIEGLAVAGVTYVCPFSSSAELKFIADTAPRPLYGMQGFLDKRGKINTKFKRRFFRIERNEQGELTLYYYVSFLDTTPRGRIPLKGARPMLTVPHAKSMSRGDCLFSIDTYKRRFVLRSRTEREKQIWINILEMLVDDVYGSLPRIKPQGQFPYDFPQLAAADANELADDLNVDVDDVAREFAASIASSGDREQRLGSHGSHPLDSLRASLASRGSVASSSDTPKQPIPEEKAYRQDYLYGQKLPARVSLSAQKPPTAVNKVADNKGVARSHDALRGMPSSGRHRENTYFGLERDEEALLMPDEQTEDDTDEPDTSGAVGVLVPARNSVEALVLSSRYSTELDVGTAPLSGRRGTDTGLPPPTSAAELSAATRLSVPSPAASGITPEQVAGTATPSLSERLSGDDSDDHKAWTHDLNNTNVTNISNETTTTDDLRGKSPSPMPPSDTDSYRSRIYDDDTGLGSTVVSTPPTPDRAAVYPPKVQDDEDNGDIKPPSTHLDPQKKSQLAAALRKERPPPRPPLPPRAQSAALLLTAERNAKGKGKGQASVVTPPVGKKPQLHEIPSVADALAVLEKGAVFLKHGRRGLPSYKLVYLLVEKGTGSKDVYRLYWTKSKQADAHRDRISNTERTYSSAYATSSKVRFFDLSDVSSVVAGKETSVLRRVIARRASPDKCLSLVNDKAGRSLDLVARDKLTRDKWFEALTTIHNVLINTNKSQRKVPPSLPPRSNTVTSSSFGVDAQWPESQQVHESDSDTTSIFSGASSSSLQWWRVPFWGTQDVMSWLTSQHQQITSLAIQTEASIIADPNSRNSPATVRAYSELDWARVIACFRRLLARGHILNGETLLQLDKTELHRMFALSLEQQHFLLAQIVGLRQRYRAAWDVHQSKMVRNSSHGSDQKDRTYSLSSIPPSPVVWDAADVGHWLQQDRRVMGLAPLVLKHGIIGIDLRDLTEQPDLFAVVLREMDACKYVDLGSATRGQAPTRSKKSSNASDSSNGSSTLTDSTTSSNSTSATPSVPPLTTENAVVATLCELFSSAAAQGEWWQVPLWRVREVRYWLSTLSAPVSHTGVMAAHFPTMFSTDVHHAVTGEFLLNLSEDVLALSYPQLSPYDCKYVLDSLRALRRIYELRRSAWASADINAASSYVSDASFADKSSFNNTPQTFDNSFFDDETLSMMASSSSATPSSSTKANASVCWREQCHRATVTVLQVPNGSSSSTATTASCFVVRDNSQILRASVHERLMLDLFAIELGMACHMSTERDVVVVFVQSGELGDATARLVSHIHSMLDVLLEAQLSGCRHGSIVLSVPAMATQSALQPPSTPTLAAPTAKVLPGLRKQVRQRFAAAERALPVQSRARGADWARSAFSPTLEEEVNDVALMSTGTGYHSPLTAPELFLHAHLSKLPALWKRHLGVIVQVLGTSPTCGPIEHLIARSLNRAHKLVVESANSNAELKNKGAASASAVLDAPAASDADAESASNPRFDLSMSVRYFLKVLLIDDRYVAAFRERHLYLVSDLVKWLAVHAPVSQSKPANDIQSRKQLFITLGELIPLMGPRYRLFKYVDFIRNRPVTSPQLNVPAEVLRGHIMANDPRLPAGPPPPVTTHSGGSQRSRTSHRRRTSRGRYRRATEYSNRVIRASERERLHASSLHSGDSSSSVTEVARNKNKKPRRPLPVRMSSTGVLGAASPSRRLLPHRGNLSPADKLSDDSSSSSSFPSSVDISRTGRDPLMDSRARPFVSSNSSNSSSATGRSQKTRRQRSRRSVASRANPFDERPGHSVRRRSLGPWERDSASERCRRCGDMFSYFNRRHHCRRCGKLVCGECSKDKYIVPGVANDPAAAGQPHDLRVRVCRPCLFTLKSADYSH